MARIVGFEVGTQNVGVAPSEVDCFHQIVTAKDGTRYLHLSTFGSAQRKSGPKSSQSIQLDEATARELVQIIGKAFPGVA